MKAFALFSEWALEPGIRGRQQGQEGWRRVATPYDTMRRLTALLARVAQRGREGPVVLLYHRIARVSTDPQLVSVTPEHFAEHLQFVGDDYQAVGLADLIQAHAGERVPSRAVAITFDDGYADNLFTAKPLLERSGVPATVFVASGYVRRRRSFWWDELERLLLRPGRLPAAFTLEIGSESLHWELDDDATYASPRAAACSDWTVLDSHEPGPRQRMYRELYARLRALDEAERERVLEQLRLLAEPRDDVDDEMPRPLTFEELVRLTEGGLVDVGAHTVSHPLLSRLPPERQREEIGGSKKELEDALGRPVSSFAYPYGAAGHFDETTVALVRAAGFERACANVPGRVGPRTDPFRLPRLLVRDWSADELSRRLAAIER